MITRFRLPDPPPELRARILSGASRPSASAARLFAPGAAVLCLGVIIWAILNESTSPAGKLQEKPPAQEPEPRITLLRLDADVHEAIAAIAREAGRSVVIAPEIKGTVSFSVQDAAWSELMRAITRTLGHTVVVEPSGLFRVVHADAFAGERATAGERPPPGANVTLDLMKASLPEAVLKILEESKGNAVVALETSGPVTVVIRNLPWADALGGLARSLGLVAVREPSGVLRVMDRGLRTREIRDKVAPPEQAGSGPRITLRMRRGHLSNIVAGLVREAGIPLEGEGKVTLDPAATGDERTLIVRFEDVPWLQALDATARTLGYRVGRNPEGGIHIFRPPPEKD